ncbi:MAG: protein translocase subunit SecD [Actinomycetota bacterium]
MTPRKKYWISLLVMVLLVGGIWGGISAAQTCETPVAQATGTPTPTASAAATASPTPRLSATPTASRSKVRAQATATPSGTASPSATPGATGSATPGATGSATPKATASPKAAAKEPAKNCKRGWKPRLGLDLQGGLSVVLTPKGTAKSDALDKAVDVIRNRVDALGVAEPDISRQGNNILIQLPGVKDPNKALTLIGTTAFMTFRPVLEEVNPGTPQYAATAPDCKVGGNKEVDATKNTSQPVVYCAAQKDATGHFTPAEFWPKLKLGPAALLGPDVSGATAQPPSGNAGGNFGWDVSLNLTSAGSKKFETITGQLACNQGAQRQLAIALDQNVESHPQMAQDVQCKQGIAQGRAQITGNFSQKEANDLALVLRYGALPVTLEASTTTTVSPTLGRDTLHTGLAAGFIGLGLVLLYVLIFYRVLGLVVWVGLAFFSAFVLGVVIILGQTAGFSLSLAGIAGLIVSVGIAADSFIVYFERLKDEVHQGRTVRAAVDRAWTSARRTIIAADLVTGLAAITLYVLAVGSVRGFALTLGLATALDVFISFLFMHPGVWLLSQTKFFNRSRQLGIGRVVGAAAESPAGGGR